MEIESLCVIHTLKDIPLATNTAIENCSDWMEKVVNDLPTVCSFLRRWTQVDSRYLRFPIRAN